MRIYLGLALSQALIIGGLLSGPLPFNVYTYEVQEKNFRYGNGHRLCYSLLLRCLISQCTMGAKSGTLIRSTSAADFHVAFYDCSSSSLFKINILLQR